MAAASVSWAARRVRVFFGAEMREEREGSRSAGEG